MLKMVFASALMTLACILAIGGSAAALERDAAVCVDLNGQWQFRLDPKDEGVAGRWFAADVAYPDKIKVPGNWQAQGFGPSRGHLRHDYQGKAWYRRAVVVPANWSGKRIWLHFGGVANTGEVYVNGSKVGLVEGYTVPYELDITDAIKPGAENAIACRVDSTGLTQGGMFNFMCHWGGLYRGAHLEARSDPAVDDVLVIPDVKNRMARVQVTLARSAGGPAWKGRLRVRITPAVGGAAAEGQGEVAIADGRRESQSATIGVAIAEMRPWSPEDPFLYHVEVSLLADDNAMDVVRDRFGMRQFEVGPGGVLLLNGRPYFVRGIGDDTVEVMTGTQYPDKRIYVDRLKQIKRYGFNGVRFLGNTPIPEYFQAADEVGVLVMAEGHEYTRDKNTIPLLRKDVARIAKAYRNHPSWYIWSAGNELFTCQGAAPDREWMDYILFAHREFKRLDPTRFFVASDGVDVFPTDIITQFGRFDGVRQNAASDQPFDGLIDEVAYFKRALDAGEVAATAAGGAEYAHKILALRPSGYWRCEETSPGKALDSSGQGDGVYEATMTAECLGQPGAFEPGLPGRAMRTDAAHQGVRLKDAAKRAFAGGNDPFSVAFWIKPSQFAPGQYGTPFSYGAAEAGAALVTAVDGGGKLVIGQYGNNVLQSNVSLAAGRWSHVGITFDGRVMRLFVDGKQNNSANVKMATVLADARIGRCISEPLSDAMYRERPQIWHEFPNLYIGPLPDATADARWTGVYQDPNCVSNVRKKIADLGLTDRYPAIRERSLKSFREFLKFQFESARHFPAMDGYGYWCMTDFPAGPEGEMTTYGIFNTVYEPDKFPSPEPMLRFNRETVLLIDNNAGPAGRVLEAGKKRDVSLLISHYGQRPIRGGRLLWELQSDRGVIQQGVVAPVTVEIGNVKSLATLSLAATASKAAEHLRLCARLESDVCRQENEWSFWAFPAAAESLRGKPMVNRTGIKALDSRYGVDASRPVEQAKLVLANRVTPQLMHDIAEGKSLLLLAEEGMLRNPGKFTFWPEWIRTSGTVLENHPALAAFPHDDFCDFQFYRLVDPNLETVPMTEKGTPGREKLGPIVWGLRQADDPSLGTEWFVPKNRWKIYRDGMVCEGRVGRAKILFCTLRVLRGIQANQPEAGGLLDSLIVYALSDRFAPTTPVMTIAEFQQLVLGDKSKSP